MSHDTAVHPGYAPPEDHVPGDAEGLSPDLGIHPVTGYDAATIRDNLTHAERAALGGMLLAKSAVTDVIDVIDAGDFYSPQHGMIFDAICAVHRGGDPVDLITVAAELTRTGELSRVGGAAYLHSLVAVTPTAANAGFYARVVLERALLRRLERAGMRITQLGRAEDGGDIEELQAAAREALDAATATTATATAAVPVADLMDSTIDEIESLTRDGVINYVSTGFIDLDDYLGGGLRAGQVLVIGGRPGDGKSTLAADIARHVAINNGLPALIALWENSPNEFMQRVLSAQARVPLKSIRKGELDEGYWARIAVARPAIDAAPLHVLDAAAVDMKWDQFEQHARRFVTAHPTTAVIVVDYLQLIQNPPGRFGNRQEEVAFMAKRVKLLARGLGVAFVVVAQLNRGPESRTDKRPQMSDFRESGELENSADIGVLIHRPDKIDPDSPRVGEADFIIAKNRNGATGTVTVAFQGHYARFVDMAV